MDKKGSSEILSIWMFLSWIIIAIFIVSAVAIFYSGSVDVREREAEVLLKKASDCIFSQNQLVYLKPTETFLGQEDISINVNEEPEDAKIDLPDIFQTCLLKKEVLDTGYYFLSFALYDKEKYIKNKLLKISFDENNIKPLYIIKTGNKDFETQCAITGKNFANCASSIFFIKDRNNAEFIAEIIAGSNQKTRLTPGVKNDK